MKILLQNAYFENKGAEALIAVTIQEISRRLPGSEFLIRDRDHSTLYDSFLNKTQITTVPPLLGNRYDRFSFLWHFYRRTDQYHIYRLRTLLAQRHRIAVEAGYVRAVDAVIDLSGFAYGDQWGLNHATNLLPIVSFAAQYLGRSFVLMPQAWGPFEKDSKLHAKVKMACRDADIVASRDTESTGHLSRINDRGEAFSIIQKPDIVFAWTPQIAMPRQLQELVDGYFPYAVVSPNMRVYERCDGIMCDNIYVRTLVDICEKLISKGWRILLVPHEITRNHYKSDDRLLCSLVAATIGHAAMCKAITGDFDALNLRGVISRASIVIGSRYHVLVNALSCGVPSFALSWSHKYRQLLELFGHERLAVSQQEIRPGLATAKVLDFASCHDQYAAEITAQLPTIKQRVSVFFDNVARTVNGKARIRNVQ